MKDMWPADIPSLLDDITVGSGKAEDWVPRDLDDMEAWAYVGTKTGSVDPTRRHALLYVSPAPSGTPRVQVSIRVQGYVERASLATLGNWTG